MRRIIIRASVVLLLGAIVNVAVAWGLAAVVDLRTSTRPGMGGTEYQWAWGWRRDPGGYFFVSTWSNDPVIHDFGGSVERLVPSWSDVPRQPTSWLRAAGTNALESDAVEARGWPRLSMFNRSNTRVQGGIKAVHATGIDLKPWPRQYAGGSPAARVLPTRPIWPGFAINTIFYAAILWLLFAVPFALRRRLRIKRGLCPACAHPIGARDVCTECGAQLQPRRGIGV